MDPNITAADFLDANQVHSWADIVEAGTIADTSAPEAVAEDMLRNWTFDGQLVPDADELVALLAAWKGTK